MYLVLQVLKDYIIKLLQNIDDKEHRIFNFRNRIKVVIFVNRKVMIKVVIKVVIIIKIKIIVEIVLLLLVIEVMVCRVIKIVMVFVD